MAKQLTANERKLRDEIPIVDYYNRFVVPTSSRFYKLSAGRKAGLCPFHHETDASFHFWDDTKMYHCFGCNVTGDVIKFHQEWMRVAEGRRLTRKDSVRELGRLFNIELVPEEQDIAPEAETPFQRARRLVSDSAGNVIPANEFSVARFRQMNAMLMGLQIPVAAKIVNYRNLDIEAAARLLSKSE